MTGFLIIFLFILTIFFVMEIRRALKRSKKTVELIKKYENDKKNPQLIDEIFQFTSTDRRLSKIIKKYNADRNDFAALHEKLMIWGDFRKYNRYIPITSFFYASTLDYLLAHKDDDSKILVQKMMNYFHI